MSVAGPERPGSRAAAAAAAAGAIAAILRAAAAGGAVGALFGAAIAAATVAGNSITSPRDALVLAAWVALAFGVLGALAAAAVAAAAAVGPLAATRALRRAIFATTSTPGHAPLSPADAGAAAAIATFLFVFALRWFEFEIAYPKSHSFLAGFASMFAFAAAFAVLAAALSFAAGAAAARVLASLRSHGRGLGPRAYFGGAAALFLSCAASAVVLRAAAPRPPSESDVAAAVLAPETSMIRAAAAAPRVVLLGCDGADPHVLDALLAEGALPHLAALFDRGVRAELATIPGRSSPAIWTSLATGCRPETHGIQDFYVQRLAGMSIPIARFPEYLGLNHGLLLHDLFGDRVVPVDPVNSRFVRRKPVWDVLAERGVSCAVVNWLVTWPADRAACPLVSERAQVAALEDPGRLDAGRKAASREDAAPAADSTLWRPAALAARFADLLADSLDVSEDAFMGEVALRLARSLEPRFLAATFRDVDAAQHLHWKEYEPRYFRDVSPAAVDSLGRRIPEAYARFDRIAGALLDWAGPDAIVFVVSDHGHGPWFTWLGRGTPGGHTNSPNGIFAAAGPGIRRGSLPSAPSCLDLAPTILHLFGLPIAEDLEGRVLTELFEGGSPLAGAASRVASYESPGRGAPEVLASPADAEILDRLKTLGYIR